MCDASPHPEGMAVEAFDLQHDRADELGARGRLDRGGLLDGLNVCHAVHAAADAADSLGEHGYFVVGQDGVGQLLDAAVDHESAVLAAADDFAFDVEPEMRRFVQGRVKGAEGNDHAPFRHLVKIVFLVLVDNSAGRNSRARLSAGGGLPRASRPAEPAA